MKKFNSNSISRNNKYNGAGGGAGGGTASDIAYDNSLSGLVSQNVQQAIDELHDEIEIGNIYTTDEKKVGEWIDGSAIYQKVFEIAELPNNTSINLDFTDGNLIDAYGYAVSKTDEKERRPVPFAGGGTNDIRISQSQNKLVVTTYAQWNTYKAFLVVKYVK